MTDMVELINTSRSSVREMIIQNSPRADNEDGPQSFSTNNSVKSSGSHTLQSSRAMDSNHTSSRYMFTMNLADPDTSINGLLINPIKSGYLLKFSQSEFNAENMIYVLEIDRFKDLCSDHKAWNDNFTYKLLDQSIDDFSSTRKVESDLVFGGNKDNEWPSTKVPYSSFLAHCKLIWNTYLANSAETQICMPARVLSNTIQRLQYLHLYGHKVFDETILDPIKTLNADVLPRFLTSDIYKTMTKRLSELYPLPSKDQLELRLPGKSACLDWPEDKLTVENLREVTVFDLFHDRVLYDEFMKYSKKIYSEENVYLARAISIFKCHFAHADPAILAAGKVPPEAEEQAWIVFRFFVAPSSAYEVSGVSPRRRKEIMHTLAHPHPDMFLALEKSIHRLVRSQYVNFSFTREFKLIPANIIAKAFNKHMEERTRRLAEIAAERRHQELIQSSCLGLGRYLSPSEKIAPDKHHHHHHRSHGTGKHRNSTSSTEDDRKQGGGGGGGTKTGASTNKSEA